MKRDLKLFRFSFYLLFLVDHMAQLINIKNKINNLNRSLHWIIAILILLFQTNCNTHKIRSLENYYENFPNSKYYTNMHQDYKSNFNQKIVYFVDSLANANVDTIGIYYEETIDHSSFSLNDDSLKTWNATIQWICKNVTSQIRMNNTKSSSVQNIEDSRIINYYIDNKAEIDSSYIMPSVVKIRRNKMQMSWGMSEYCKIYCILKGESSYFCFDKFHVYNTRNLYYNRNINSALIKWKNEIINN
ncbi:MAG: hypothetical protein U0T82_16230 [Bacteroidales bacterium]